MAGSESVFIQPVPLTSLGLSQGASSGSPPETANTNTNTSTKKKARRATEPSNQKRRCISTACIACRKRKSKCDGALPSCAACASVYGTECIYDPNSDHRRKGVYREKVDSMKARNSTLQILIEAILNAADDDVPGIVGKIRGCDNLDSVAEQILKPGPEIEDDSRETTDEEHFALMPLEGERELARKMGELRLENGSLRFIGGTSHLIYLGDPKQGLETEPTPEQFLSNQNPITSWTNVTTDPNLITHLMNMYFNYDYACFTTLSKKLFWRDFMKGRRKVPHGRAYCSTLLVNAILALGCHFTDVPGAYAVPLDSRTKGDHFFAEAKRLILSNDEYAKPRLVTIQALALMSMREAGCARETQGWVFSGMSFRMAQDIGLNLEVNGSDKERLSDDEIDARRITFWGCFLFDKCWSNYMGRLPQLPKDSFNVAKFDVFPDEEAAMWSPFNDKGFDEAMQQPSRIRAGALQLSKLCEISSDLLTFFYHPTHVGKPSGKSLQLKKLSELHQRLEEWRKELPMEFEPKDGQLPNVILMHMFFHLQYIHLFRPFLKYDTSSSPLPAHVSPRRICTANAGAISKLMRLYKKTYNLRRICNIAVYMTHNACTIHLLNLPEKTAKRDITHGVRHLEEIAEDWLCARRTLSILSVLARKWNCELPGEAAFVLQRTDEKYGQYDAPEIVTPRSGATTSSRMPDDGSLAKSQDYSPLTQYTPAHLSQIRPPASIDDRMTMNSNVQSINRLPQGPQVIPLDSPRLNFNPELMGRWDPTPATAPASGYNTPFPSMDRNGMAQNGTSQPNTRQVSPGHNVAMPGQEWTIPDSARWHQSFENWDMNRNMLKPSNFIFEDDRGDEDITMRRDSSEPMSGFEGLDASLDAGGWLPGLD